MNLIYVLWFVNGSGESIENVENWMWCNNYCKLWLFTY